VIWALSQLSNLAVAKSIISSKRTTTISIITIEFNVAYAVVVITLSIIAIKDNGIIRVRIFVVMDSVKKKISVFVCFRVVLLSILFIHFLFLFYMTI
ncbi:hypothetical protein, partial [Raoultella terrigena]|uniref:hypothetical protein n=1 Tax=Raoultella terrigena TaxID=577 RepID=UPI001F30B05D